VIKSPESSTNLGRELHPATSVDSVLLDRAYSQAPYPSTTQIRASDHILTTGLSATMQHDIEKLADWEIVFEHFTHILQKARRTLKSSYVNSYFLIRV
jgi:hypothetical protein